MKKGIFLLSVFYMLRIISFACGWDWDTLQMEKQKFPQIHELIAGNFLRHSNEFYVWRIEDRTKKIKKHPDSLDLYDDLAWAYDKLGFHNKAIKTMLKKEDIAAGQYKTYANLGTSYIHNKQYKEGLKYIKKAIEINPDAHFGREIYQQYLVEYVLEKTDSSGKINLPLSEGSEPDFYTYIDNRHIKRVTQGSNKEEELAKAVKGIAGMMKFGDHTSPVLLEALGDLLYAAKVGIDPGAGHLASRAYMKAGMETGMEKIKKKYYKKAAIAIEKQYSSFERAKPMNNMPVMSLKKLENALQIEMLEAQIFMDSIKQNEKLWIKQGINVDSAFAANYYNDLISKEGYNPKTYRYSNNLNALNLLKHELKDTAYRHSIFGTRTVDAYLSHKVEAINISLIDSLTPVQTTLRSQQTPEDTGKRDSSATNWLVLFFILIPVGLIIYLIIKNR